MKDQLKSTSLEAEYCRREVYRQHEAYQTRYLIAEQAERLAPQRAGRLTRHYDLQVRYTAVLECVDSLPDEPPLPLSSSTPRPLEPSPRIGMMRAMMTLTPRVRKRTPKGEWKDPETESAHSVLSPRSRRQEKTNSPAVRHPKSTATPSSPPVPPTDEVIADKDELPADELAPTADARDKAGSPDLPLNESTPVNSLREVNHGSFNEFVRCVRLGYEQDALMRVVLAAPAQHASFLVSDDLLYLRLKDSSVLCIPDVVFRERRAREILIDHAHTTLGHAGPQKTIAFITQLYWWPTIRREARAFCETCDTCQITKDDHRKPAGFLHSLPLPERPWQSVSMDFLGPLPESRGFDLIWVVMDRLTSMTHLIPTTLSVAAPDLATLFLEHVVRLHGVPESIVSDRDPRFTSKFWRELHRSLGANLLMSTAFHPQTDGLTERRIKSVSSILRAVVSDDQKDWSQKLPMTEFALNSSSNASSGFAPFELNYGFIPSTIPVISGRSSAPGVTSFVEEARLSVSSAIDALIASRVAQTHQSNRHRREEPEYSVGDKVYLSTRNISMPKGLAIKLLPRFIGPYRITKADPSRSRYTLDIPSILEARGVFSTFHVSLLRPHHKSDDKLFPNRAYRHEYDLEGLTEPEYEVDEILAHKWEGRSIQFLVKWTVGDSTWVPYKDAKHLKALDAYLILRNVRDWKELGRASSE